MKKCGRPAQVCYFFYPAKRRRHRKERGAENPACFFERLEPWVTEGETGDDAEHWAGTLNVQTGKRPVMNKEGTAPERVARSGERRDQGAVVPGGSGGGAGAGHDGGGLAALWGR